MWVVIAAGAMPLQAASFAYITNPGNDTTVGTVSVVDTATNTVVATVPVGDFPIGVAVAPDGRFVYAANRRSSTVSVIETATNTVVTTVPVGDNPVGVAGSRRCSSLTYSRYARSSRLTSQALRRPEWHPYFRQGPKGSADALSASPATQDATCGSLKMPAHVCALL